MAGQNSWVPRGYRWFDPQAALPSPDITTPEGRQQVGLLGIYNWLPMMGAAGARYGSGMLGSAANAMRLATGNNQDIYRAFQAAGNPSFIPSSAYAPGRAGTDIAQSLQGLKQLAAYYGGVGPNYGGVGPSTMNDYLNSVLASFGGQTAAPRSMDEWINYRRAVEQALSLQPTAEEGVPTELVALVQAALQPHLVQTPLFMPGAPQMPNLSRWWR